MNIGDGHTQIRGVSTLQLHHGGLDEIVLKEMKVRYPESKYPHLNYAYCIDSCRIHLWVTDARPFLTIQFLEDSNIELFRSDDTLAFNGIWLDNPYKKEFGMVILMFHITDPACFPKIWEAVDQTVEYWTSNEEQ